MQIIPKPVQSELGDIAGEIDESVRLPGHPISTTCRFCFLIQVAELSRRDCCLAVCRSTVDVFLRACDLLIHVKWRVPVQSPHTIPDSVYGKNAIGVIIVAVVLRFP